MRKIFKHTGQGKWIGSCIIVVAANRPHAERMIRTTLDENGLCDEELSIEEFDLDKTCIIHTDNGDY